MTQPPRRCTIMWTGADRRARTAARTIPTRGALVMKTTRAAAALSLLPLMLAGCGRRERPADALATATPIKHLVIIFGENISFDHYFATYPVAANPPGEPAFTAAARHAGRERPRGRPADPQPQPHQPAQRRAGEQPVPPRPHPGRHGRPVARLHRGAAGVRRRRRRPLSRATPARACRAARRVLHAGRGDGRTTTATP